MSRFTGRTATLRWHKPLCTDCEQPIETLDDAYAAWIVTDEGNTEPQVHHRNRICGHYNRGRNAVNDLPVEWIRRAPAEALLIAFHARLRQGKSWNNDREDWLRWVVIVLGLPGNDGGWLHELHFKNTVATVATMCVQHDHIDDDEDEDR